MSKIIKNHQSYILNTQSRRAVQIQKSIINLVIFWKKSTVVGIFHDLLVILSKITSMSLVIFGTSGGMSPHRKSLTSTDLNIQPRREGIHHLHLYTSQRDGKHIFDSQKRILPLKITFFISSAPWPKIWSPWLHFHRPMTPLGTKVMGVEFPGCDILDPLEFLLVSLF